MRELSRGRVSAIAALAAVVVVLLAAPCALADGPGDRDGTSHVLIGVSPGSSFGVAVDGEALPEGSVESDSLGILDFAVDGGAPGVHTVYVSLLEPLALSSVAVDSVTPSSAVVRWQTNIPSNSSVQYGLTSDYGDDTGIDPQMTLFHRMLLEGLAPGSTYHFRAVSTDVFDRTSDSGDHVFETLALDFEIADVTVSGLGATWAVIGWTTTRPATSRVEYGLTDEYGQETVEDTLAVVEHSVVLTGLLNGTSYHFRAHSRDGYGADASSPDSTFTTMELEPTGPPIMGNVGAFSERLNSIVVTWTTDRPATSQVRYGTEGDLDCCTEADPTLVIAHVVRVRPVAPTHEYTFVTLSACGADTAEGAPFVFATELPDVSSSDGKGVTIARPGIVCVADTAATIAWSTDRPCSTWVEYGIDEDLGSVSFSLPGGGCTHEASLTGLAPGTLYYYRVCAWDEFGGAVWQDGGTFETCELVGPDLPGAAGLRFSIQPNPTLGSATLAYAATPGALVRARIYTATGRLVREISRAAAQSGEGSLEWDGRDSLNRPVGSGVYLCELSDGGSPVRRKFTVLR
jgi:hypothetical protein